MKFYLCCKFSSEDRRMTCMFLTDFKSFLVAQHNYMWQGPRRPTHFYLPVSFIFSICHLIELQKKITWFAYNLSDTDRNQAGGKIFRNTSASARTMVPTTLTGFMSACERSSRRINVTWIIHTAFLQGKYTSCTSVSWHSVGYVELVLLVYS